MTEARGVVVVIAALAIELTSGCGGSSSRIRTPERVSRDQVVLLPDPESGTVGHAAVSNTAGRVDLARPRESTMVSTRQAPSPVTQLSEDEVVRLFGDVLSALPAPPQHFTLYFRFESDELTDESRMLVNDVLRSVKEQPAPDVVVVGHTDTTGTPASNFDLGLKRANMVRALLIAAGLNPSLVNVASHGEADLLVPTPDETFEPRNRRVEITIR